MGRPPKKDTGDQASADKLARHQERSSAHETKIRQAILAWLAPRDNRGDYVSITRALLHIALDRHVEVHEADGFDLIEAAYHRAVQRSRGSVH